MIDRLDGRLASALLEFSPLGIALFDGKNRIGWVNHRMSEMTGLPLEALRNLDRDTALNHRLEALFDKPERLELDTRGQHTRTCLECRYETLASASGESIQAAFYLDKTEQSRLEARVERLNLSDELTGNLNQRGLLRELDTLVSRSRRYHNPLSVMMLELDLPAGVQTNEYILAISRCLRNQLRWADIIGRFSDNSFLLLLPETDIGAAQALAQKIFEQLAKIPLDDVLQVRPQAYCGVSQWQRGNDVNILLERVATALASARSSESEQFVAA